MARWVTPENKDGIEKREIYKARGAIDLAEQFENGTLGVWNPLEENPEDLRQEPSIDLSLLITDPGAISEEEIMWDIPPVKEDAEEEVIETESAEIDQELDGTKGNEETTEDSQTEAGDDIDVTTKDTEDKGGEEPTWDEQHNNEPENKQDENDKLWEKEREFLIAQLNAKWILTSKNIGDAKLVEKARKAWLL